jgi:CRISPR system Cascade subunit CasA
MSKERSKDFCLLDKPWLPVRQANGHIKLLSLLDVFRHSGEISGLAETTPPSLVAEYRLLLAITHRALTRAFGSWKDKDRARWHREGLPADEICAYLEHWRERFWLFHPQYPFMQVAVLADAAETREKRKPWTQIALASASGGTPLVFDHACDETPASIFPAEALAALLGYLQFTPGGLVRTLRDADRAGALANTAAVLPTGETLARTLCLCLHPAATGNEAASDLPAWEREPLTIQQLSGAPVLATGPNDRYTRQSRAVLLLREQDGAIRWLRFAAGWALGEDANAPDPMASFRAGNDGLVRLGFTEGRGFWRDLPALVPNPAGTSQPAAVLSHAIDLHQTDSFGEVFQPLLIAGLASDQAKLLRWRIEQIALPAVLLTDIEKASYLRELLALAEELFRDLSSLATSMLADILPDSSHKDTRSHARGLLRKGPFTVSYFSFAERALPELLSLLGKGKNEETETYWRDILRKAAFHAWKRILAELGYSARALKADAKFMARFHGVLNKHLPEPESTISKEA